VKIGRHTFNLKALQPMTLGDMAAIQALGIEVKKLEDMTPAQIIKFVLHFIQKIDPGITEEDVGCLSTHAVRAIMEKLNAEPDEDFLSN
jgi:hypothetical protein